MKRFYKFLMPLVAIVAMALPVDVMAQDSCSITIAGFDSYGDGWNGGTLAVKRGTTTLTTFTLPSGSSSLSTTVALPDGDTVSFVWTSGSYDDEVSFTIYGPSNEVLYTAEEPTAGTVYTLNGLVCPSCIAPTSFAASVTGSTVDFSWVDANAASWEIAYGGVGFDPDEADDVETASDNTYQLTGMDDGMYEAYVRSDCGGEYSIWVGPISFNVGITIMNMATSGTDTLRSCTAIIYDDGGPTGQYSNSCQSTLVIYPADDLHAVQISGTSQTEGSYDYLTIYSGVGTSGEILFCDNTSGDDAVHTFGPFLTTGAFTVVFHSDGSVQKNGFQINVTCQGLPDCTQPETFVLEAIDSGSVSFSWTDNTNTDWTIGYGPHGFTLGSANTLWEDFSDTTGTVSGLAPNTVYDFYLMANCGSDSSWTRMLTARTACAPIDTLPYVQNFNNCATGSANLFDPCWNIYNTYSATANYPYVTGGYLYMYLYSSNGTIGQQYGYAMLPMISDDLANTDMEISFDIWKSSSTGYNSGVVVGLFDGGLYDANHPIDTLAVIVPTATSQAAAETYYVSIIDRDLTGKRIGFLYQNQDPTATNTYYYYTYIDNVHLHEAPNCFVPSGLTVNAAQADSVILSWSDTVATAWQVALGAQGFNPDTVDTPIAVTETELVLDDLMGGQSYQAYVRADCGDGQSMWIGPVSFSPGQINMGITGSATMNVCGAVIYDDGGPTGQYSNNCHYTLTLYPNDENKRFKFWGSGVTEGTIDYLRVYAGATASGTMLGQINNSNPTIDTVTTQGGPITLLFHSDGSIVYAGFEFHVVCIDMAACRDIEDVTVEEVSTSSAYVTWRNAIGTTPMPNSYIVTVTDTAGTTVSTVTTTDMYAIVGGMQAGNDYTVSVVPACDEANGEPATVSFTTAGFGCLQVDTTLAFSDTIGNGTSTSTYLPSYSFYNYGLTQQIYTAAEIGHGGQIDNISFKWSTVSQQRTYEIYMGHVSSATASDYVHPADLTLVYNGGPVNLTANAWTTFNLTTPFNYNGTDNLVVIMRDMTGSYVSGNAGYVHSVSDGAARYAYQDSGPYDPYTYSGGTSLSVRNNIIIGGAPCAVEATCANPLVVATVDDATSVTLMWAAGGQETSWDVEHMAAGDAGWTTDLAGTTTNSYTYTGLTPNTLYQFRVLHVCGTDTFATVRTVRTACVGMSVPFTENFSTWNTGTGAAMPSACWFKGSDYNSSYPYVTTGNSMAGDNNSMYFYASGTTFTYLALPKFDAPLDTLVVTGYIKYSSAGYALQVGRMTDPEDATTFVPLGGATTVANTWVPFEVVYAGQPDGYIAFGVGNGGSYAYLYLDNIEVNYYNPCERPTNVNDRNATLNAATIYWTDTVTNDFVVEYGPVGFEHGTGTILNVNGADTVQITGLNHSSRYDVYVRGICTGGDSSSWSFVHTFATQCGAIDVLPFTEDFESWGTGSTVHAPNCWTYGSTYSTTYPYISTNTTHGGVMYMYVYASTAGDPSKYTWFALPELSPTVATVNQTQIIFSTYTSTSSYEHLLTVGVSNSPSSLDSVVWIDTVVAHYNVWEEHEIAFDTYSGTGRYIVFKAMSAPGYSYSYPYIDDITLEMIPSCRRPDTLYATNATTNTVDLGWNDRSGASQWIIEYGPTGFELGTGTQVTATSNPFTVTGLPTAYQGEFYVKAVCGAGDTSEFSRHPQGFATSQVPATLPYNYDFENGAEWANWQTSTNSATNNWYRGTAVADSGSYSIYMSADSGATYVPYQFNAVVNAAAFRDIDFGPIDSSYTLSFRARVGGTTTNAYDGLMVFLVDPALPTVASSSGITSPWGNVNNLYRIATVRLDTVWTTYEASFDTISGIHRVAFFWFNQNTGASYANIPEAAAVDNIHIKYATCPRPVNVHALTAGSTSATLTWTGAATGTYEVVYRQVGGTNHMVTTNTNSVTLTGLTSAASYYAWVRKVCGAGDTSLYSDRADFETSLCDGAVMASTGAQTSTEYYAPVNNFYNYTLSETLIDSAELAGVGEISSIAYYYDYATASTSKSNVTIWLQPTTKTSFSSSSDIVVLDTATAVQVYSGNLNCSQGWNYFAFTNNFNWDGHSNVVVIVDDNSGDYDGSAYVFASASTTAYKTIYYYSDSYNPDPMNPSSISGTTSYAMWRPVMELVSCGAANLCATPVVAVSNINYNSATIAATGTGNNFELTYGLSSTNMPNTMTSTTGVFNLTGLTPNTTYYYAVRQECDSSVVSEWALGTFTTDDLPCLRPTNLHVTATTVNSATLAWTPGDAAQANFEVRYSTSGDTTSVTSGNPCNLTNLLYATEYSVSVRAICAEGIYSDWSDTITFSTDTCGRVTNVHMGTITATTATIEWNGSAAGYEVAYGDQGTTTEQCERVTATGTSYTLTGLDPDSYYDVYVRSVCAEGAYSDWSPVTTFHTLEGTGETYTLTLNVNDPAMGSVSGAGSYAAGTTVTITATPNEGYQFVNWTGGAVASATSATTTVTMNGNVTLTANFTATQGIDDVDGSAISLYPNPASSTVTLSGLESQAQVTIVDMNGREVYSGMAADGRLTINVSGMTQGAYFVRITGENVNAIRKLIVR